MQTKISPRQRLELGYALVTVMCIAGVALLVFASAASWTTTGTRLNDRRNTYVAAVSAAEAASELAVGYLARDFYNQSFNPAALSAYCRIVPTNDWAGAYEFSDGTGLTQQSWVNSSAITLTTNLDSEFTGLYGMAYNCTVRCNAKPVDSPYNLAGAVQQNLQLASIPVFQFAIFYEMELEINPGPAMTVSGRVHSNGNIYTSPGASLEFADAVTAAGQIIYARDPNDPQSSSGIVPVFDSQHVSGVSSLTLPVGADNSPAGVHQILEVPPYGELPSSPAGAARMYNKCDLVITTTAAGVAVATGNWDNFLPLVGDTSAGALTNGGYSFVNTNATFFDARENKWTTTTEIDVAALSKWMANSGSTFNSLAGYRLGHQLNSIYVDDQRKATGKLTSVRVVNGQQLPPSGLTIATSLPLYVQGNFNAPDLTVGSTNTVNTKPASLMGDAISVLSAGWSDSNSKSSLSQRPALNTTVNAAFLAGIVQTTNSNGIKEYSGGVENFPRFLEDWSGKTLTYNGSMVVMFPSQYATNFWISPGTYYNPPVREWAFDSNFLQYNRLPPTTPQVQKVIRGQWSVIAANTSN